MTSKENLKAIIASLPANTPEITVVVLKSQFGKRHKESLSRNGYGG
jgi:hypothetical protein